MRTKWRTCNCFSRRYIRFHSIAMINFRYCFLRHRFHYLLCDFGHYNQRKKIKLKFFETTNFGKTDDFVGFVLFPQQTKASSQFSKQEILVLTSRWCCTTILIPSDFSMMADDLNVDSIISRLLEGKTL